MDFLFPRCLAFTGREEGGFSTDPLDGGCFVSGRPGDGPLIGSNHGISAAILAKHLSPRCAPTFDMMRDISAATVEAIYRTEFWLPMSCDGLPAGLDLSVMDFGFNDGGPESCRILQELLGFTGDTADGWIGPETLRAIAKIAGRALLDRVDANSVHVLQEALGLKTDGVIGPQTQDAIARRSDAVTLLLICGLATRQAAHYRTLAGFPRYGAGWLARNVRRQAAALSLAIHDATMVDG